MAMTDGDPHRLDSWQNTPCPPTPKYKLSLQDEIRPTVPPNHHYRTLVLCFDGTGDQFDNDNSNIVEFFSLLKKDHPEKQMVYYQAGIGTYLGHSVATPFISKISKALDEAIAWNLASHVMQGYEFLMQNYKAGDSICIFGFSRGAYTARGLAGMLHKVGLIPPCNHQQVPFAYKMFTSTNELGWRQSNAFKKAFSIDVEIEFIGVWDTVHSVGIFPRRLPFTTSNTIVRTFRHAISLDERRSKFKANLWNRPTEKEESLGIPSRKKKSGATQTMGQRKTTNGSGGHHHNKVVYNEKLLAMESKYSGHNNYITDVEEVWFAGCHCDVGGGSVENGTPNTLARITLRWMIRECFKRESGILFIGDLLYDIGLDPASLYPEVKARPQALSGNGATIQKIPKQKQSSILPTSDRTSDRLSEEEHERLDALSPVYDQLTLGPSWWILEIVPFKQRWQRSNGNWESSVHANLGRGRFIPKQKTGVVKVHRSVKLRMEARHADGSEYIPHASFVEALKAGKVIWVD